MRCEYVVTYKDFLESVKAYRKLSKQALNSYWLYLWILPTLGGTLGLALVSFYLGAVIYNLDSTFWVGILCLGISIAFPLIYIRGLRRAFRQRSALAQGGMMQCEFDENTVRFITPTVAEISYPWGTFTNYFENEAVAVLFVKDAAFHTIPKRAMDQGGWSKFRAIVHHHTGIKSC